MKQLVFLLLLFSANEAIAQENQNVYLATNSRPRNSFSWQPGSEANMKGYINNVNSRAARHLLKNFGDANIIRWEIDEHETTAYFTHGDEQVKVRYDKDGHHISTRKTYAGDKLDRYVAFMAKKDLEKDFLISGVTELRTEDGTIYEIILQNKSYWCVVRIAESREGLLEKLSENEVFLKA